MTRDTPVAMLDLDSQIQLLSRIQFLTRFSSNLIQVTGREGAGKTWLAQRYLEQWADSSNQTLLLCHPSQTDSQHRSIILKQLVAKPVFNEQDPLQQSVERMLGGGVANLLLVIDDAHLLSATLVAELWALVQMAQAEPGWQINVLLFSQTGRLDKYLGQVSHGQGGTPLELEITDFSEQEVQTFVEVMFASDQLDANGRRSLRERAGAMPPIPGALVQLDHTEQTTMSGSPSRKLSSLALLAILLVVVTAGLVFLFFPASEQGSVTVQGDSPQQATEDRQGPVLSTGRFDEQEIERLPLPELEEAIPLVEKPVVDTVSDDSHRLPPEMSLEGLTVGRSDDSQRVVVPSDVVDAMISEQALGGSGEQAVADQVVVEQASVAQTVTEQAAVEELQPAQALEQTENEPAAVVSAPASTPMADESVAVTPEAQPDVQPESTNPGAELKTIDQRHYALQLAALRSLSAANNFIAEYQIVQIASIYETRRDGEPWFIVITGDYPDMLSARRAETRLPERLQVVQPWVKSYAQIHREIDRVK